ncbi:hypothetical protein vseg_004903 [Gypsophila vaccaria]
MGKGGGCVPSKKKPTAARTTTTQPPPSKPPTSLSSSSSASIQLDPTSPPPPPTTTAATTSTTTTTTTTKPVKLFIVFYSMYGHVECLAKAMMKGASSVPGVEPLMYRVPETLSEDVLDQMRAPIKDDSIPVIPSPAHLEAADGFLFGFPTRYGSMAAQMKAFFDSTAALWKDQSLAAKPAGFFVSTGTQGGGQETTAWTAITQLAHHGMLFVPIGYTFGAGMFKMDSIRGGSPYGAGVFAGDGTRQPTDTELALAEHQGKYMAAVVKRLAQP